ncbi:hypothetical protein E8E13_002907 [Curvularia kusanoi]|uniref:AB hydrolase-1 domain-containing protein n=1 Tax=Curvularia kusanoi TaxID=90978 RepID=A0A9P4TFI0_CURKU|nr:hypothetical protein E8E13_002907 [Curvularia kusanoi]
MDALSAQSPTAGAPGAAYTSKGPAEHALDSPPSQSQNQTLRSRRRTSLPSSVKTTALSVDTGARLHKKRSPNYIRTQAASPEVISSLIDQLSAISASTQSHFENLPTSPAPQASRGSQTSVTGVGYNGNAGDRSPYYSAVRDQNDLYPDDACEPPIVRTSKPPSGRSAITAPPKTRKEKAHSLNNYIGRSGGSSASIHSCHSHRSSNSFGNISIEAGPKPVAGGGGGSARSSIESKRSIKRPKSLMYMSSRERLKQKETDSRKRFEDATSPISPRKPASQLFSYEDTIKEEPMSKDEHDPTSSAGSARLAPRHSGRNPSPARRIRLNLVDGPSGESPLEQGLIPDRASSLRHGSPKKSKRVSSARSRDKGKEVERPKTVAGSVPDGPPTPIMDFEEARKQRMLLELEQEENEVAQRIKQLKEQKLLREKLAGQLPADGAAGIGDVGAEPYVSGLLSREDASKAIMQSALEDRRQDSMEARKFLGTPSPSFRRLSTESDLNKPLPSISPREPTRPAPLPPHLRHSRHRSLTMNDSDDIPLPINYALALQSLDRSAPNSPRTPRVDSTQMTLPPPSSFGAMSTQSNGSIRDGMKRSNSVSVGGRSAFGRRTNSMVMNVNVSKHRHSSSLTGDRPPTFRSASEEISSGRHSSMSMTSASNSFALQQKKTVKKKRWSHPDLPAKAEKAHNAKVDKAEAAERKAAESRTSQYPYSPVIEERTTSLDAVDMEVEAFLHAPRLSQKIRHPQTGRIISFSEVGDPNGYAVFVCVGMGLTRFVMAFYDQLAATLKLRLITPERPGVAGSSVDPNGTPLTWPDDVSIICQALRITKFSLLAHSAGAIYALATSLRMPQSIRGRVHLLAPWIPPSQMAPIGLGKESPPTTQLPRSQRFLRALPESLLRVANSTFLSNTSASLQRTGPAKAPKPRRQKTAPTLTSRAETPPPLPLSKDNRRESMLLMDQVLPNASSLTLTVTNTHDPVAEKARLAALSRAERERQHAFDERLTFAIWDRATAGANPATDLIVCLETKQTIGFRYEDINRPVVIHHGSKDSRVPVDNVRWLGKLMRKCEVRVLEGEQHGLMASAQVMGNVLTEIAQDWEDWTAVVKQASVSDLRSLARRKASFA